MAGQMPVVVVSPRLSWQLLCTKRGECPLGSGCTTLSSAQALISDLPSTGSSPSSSAPFYPVLSLNSQVVLWHPPYSLLLSSNVELQSPTLLLLTVLIHLQRPPFWLQIRYVSLPKQDVPLPPESPPRIVWHRTVAIAWWHQNNIGWQLGEAILIPSLEGPNYSEINFYLWDTLVMSC